MIKSIMDWSAVAVGAGALVKVLPPLAALWTIAYLSIRIWESQTVRCWRKRGKVTQGEKVDTLFVPRYLKEDDNSDPGR